MAEPSQMISMSATPSLDAPAADTRRGVFSRAVAFLAADGAAGRVELAAWCFGAVAACLLTELEWIVYRRERAVSQVSLWQQFCFIWFVFAKNLVLFLVAGIAAAALRGLRLRRLSLAVFVTAALLAVGLLSLDLRLVDATGNHLMHYVRFAATPGAATWVGGSRSLAIQIARELALVALAAFALMTLGYGIAGTVARRWAFLVRGRGRLIVPLACIPLVAHPIYQAVSADWDFRAASWLLDQTFFPGIPSSVKIPDSPGLLEFRRQVESPLLTRALLSAAFTPQDADYGVRIPPGESRNVVIIALESLRTELMSPERMPRLWAIVRANGVRFSNHYAAENGSQLGIFSILYGRSAIGYWPNVLGGVPPQSCVTFRQSGYRATWLSSQDCRGWAGMERFLAAPEVFDEAVEPRDSAPMRMYEARDAWPEADRRIIQRVGQLVRGRERQFVLAFLASTHFPYKYPPQYQHHRPCREDDGSSLVTIREKERVQNRYWNAAEYTDDLIADFIQTLDLDRNIVVVTGDHGESFWEDGTFSHLSRLSDVQTQVPLLMFGAGKGRPRVVGGFTTHADILPTILHELGASRPAGCHGRDALSGSSNPAAAGVLLSSPGDMSPMAAPGVPPKIEAVLVGPGERLCLRVIREPASVEVVGVADKAGTIYYGVAPKGSAADWRPVLADQTQRLSGSNR